MALIFCAIYFGPYKRFTRTTDRQVMAASVDNIRKLILTNLVLGVITIVVATVG